MLSAGVALILGSGSASAAVTVDKTVTTHQASSASTVKSPTFSTSAAGELAIAFITSDGPATGASQSFSAVAGGGLTWRLLRRA